MTREDLEGNQAAFLHFQKLVLASQVALETRAGQELMLSDRSIVDPLAYTSWRFGVDSQQVLVLTALSLAAMCCGKQFSTDSAAFACCKV